MPLPIGQRKYALAIPNWMSKSLNSVTWYDLVQQFMKRYWPNLGLKRQKLRPLPKASEKDDEMGAKINMLWYTPICVRNYVTQMWLN